MAVHTYAFTSVANVKAYLGISGATYDTLIELFINGCTDWMEQEMGGRRIFDDAVVSNELHDGDWDHTGRCKIFPKRWPINSITSVEYKTGSLSSPTWVAFTTDEYVTDDAAGIMYFTSSLSSMVPNRQNIRITYQGGYTTIPSDLELACIKMVAKEFDKRKSQGVTQESVGGGTVTWNEEVDQEIMQIIRRYRRFF